MGSCYMIRHQPRFLRHQTKRERETWREGQEEEPTKEYLILGVEGCQLIHIAEQTTIPALLLHSLFTAHKRKILLITWL